VIEIESVRPERTRAFWSEHEREALSSLYEFRVVWHEQTHELAATSSEEIVGVLRMRIAASLVRLEMLVTAPAHRRLGIGRALLTRCEELGKYYNCHKVALEVPANGAAQAFLTACGYKTEAILPQHVFKLDCAAMRKFLL
jgi:ribosomal protein S18 acetylase RimI-like enzyme